jgi:tetratricopeptide (TPR) repeat protein
MATSSAGECGCRERSCDALVAGQAWDQAAAVCRDTYERTRSTAAGVAAARSLLRHGEPEEAEHLARILTTSDRAGDAFLVLGDAAAQRDDSDASMAAYDEAARACQRENNEAGASRAQNGLAGVWLARGNLAKAMEASQLAIDHAVHAADLPMQLYARLGHADLLRRQGLLVAAEEELAHAADLARTPRDQAWVALKHGILYIELDLDSLARSHLERVLVTARSGLVAPEVVMAAHLNLAWVERRAGNLAGAMHHVEDAAAIDANDIDVRVNRALVLADQERLDDAAHELTLAAQGTAGQRLWWVAYNQGLIAGRRRDVEGQLTAFRRSIEGVRAMSSHAGSYAPDVAASHREPFLRLIGVHARRAEWKTALGLVMELDALALLSTERPPPQRPVDISSAKPVGPSTVAKVPAVETVVEAWRGRRLVIVASDEETLWRLEIRDGRVTGEAVGVAAALETVARRLEADPTDAVAAGALGAAIVPPGVEGELLDVLLIGAIARTPLAALMHDGHMIIGRTPLARVLGILPRAAHPARSGASVVLGDPREDLPSARAEAIAVAATLGVAPQLGREATSSALAGARGAGLLHIAAHSVIDTEGPRLLLADRAVSPADILASDGAPAVVVLASCGGTEARDDAGWGSLAAAYIAAGADAVLASSWSVEDAATRRFVEELYRHPVREQPASALAAAQVSSRAALPARVWAGFTIIAAPPPLSL